MKLFEIAKSEQIGGNTTFKNKISVANEQEPHLPKYLDNTDMLLSDIECRAFSVERCSNLVDLTGSPKTVEGLISISYCANLSSLKGLPKTSASLILYSLPNIVNFNDLHGFRFNIENNVLKMNNLIRLETFKGLPKNTSVLLIEGDIGGVKSLSPLWDLNLTRLDITPTHMPDKWERALRIFQGHILDKTKNYLIVAKDLRNAGLDEFV